MSLLKDFTDFLDRNFDTPAEAAQRIDEEIESAKAFLGETLEYVAPEGTKQRTVLDKAAQIGQAFGAGISTIPLLADKQNPAYKDGFQISDIKETYYGPARQISPAQALFGASEIAPFNLPRKAFNVAEDLGFNVPTGGRRDFDIYNEEQRRIAFDEELIGKFSTGAADFMVSWYADPFVVGAEAGLLAKNKLINPKVPLGDVEAIREMIPLTKVKRPSEDLTYTELDEMLGVPRPAPVKTPKEKRTGASAFIDFALRTDATGILKHPFARNSSNPDAIAGIFGDINVENYGIKARPIAENTLRALFGDEKALKVLEKEAASIGDMIDRLSTREFARATSSRKFGIQLLADFTFDGDVNAMLLRNQEEGLKYKNILDDVKTRNASLRNLLNRVKDNVVESPFLGTKAIAPSRFSLVEDARAKIAETKTKAFINDRFFFTEPIEGLEWTSKVFKLSNHDWPVRVISWSGLQQPSGWVPFKGIGSSGSADELIAFMDKVRPWRSKNGVDVKRNLLNQYLRAQTDADRIVIITKIENQAVKAINKRYGLDRKLTESEKVTVDNLKIKKMDGSGPATTLADMIKWKIDQKRNNVLEHYRSKQFAYNDGEWVFTDPTLSAQLGDAMPMLDIKLYQSFASRELSAVKKGLSYAGAGWKAVEGAIDAVWRPVTLLRLAYPQRNVISESFRTVIYHEGILEMMTGIARGTGNATNNLYHNVVGNRIQKYVLAKELGLSVPKTMLGSYKSILKWNKVELDVTKKNYNEKTAMLDLARTKLARNMELKTDTRSLKKNQDILEKRKELKQEVKLLNKEVSELEPQLIEQQKFYGELLKAVDNIQQKPGGKSNKYTQGKADIVVGDLIFKGARSGALGSIGTKLVSAGQKQKKEIRNPSKQSTRYTSYGWKTLDPNSPDYYPALYVQARQLRETEVTRRMLLIDVTRGKRHVVSELNKIKKWFLSDDRLAQIEFRNTKVTKPKEIARDPDKKLTKKEQKELAISIEKRKKSKYDIDNYIALRWSEVQNYFPDQSLRFDIANRPYEQIPSPAELEARLGQLEIENKLSPIPGEAFEITQKTLPKLYGRFVDTFFKYLGTIPEDNFIRVPFYTSIYEEAINNGAKLLQQKTKRTGKAATELEIRGVEKAAHREALKESKTILYTVERYSNIVPLLSFAMPFIQAGINTTRVTGKLLLNNPKPLIRPTTVWGDEWNEKLVDKDSSTGEPLITVQIPNSWKKYPGFKELESVSFPVTRLFIPFSGEPWWNPGAGPVLQLSVSNFVNAVPHLDLAVESKTGYNIPIRKNFEQYVLPFGPSREPLSYDLLLPAWTKRGVSATRQLNDQSFLTTANKFLAIENQKFRDGTRNDEPTPEEIVARTTWFFMLRLGFNQALAVVPILNVEYKQYFDIYRGYAEKYGIEKADAMFYENYPEFYEMVITSPTKNTTGADATSISSQQISTNESLIAKIQTEDPYVTALITNPWGVDKEGNTFDRAAYNFQFRNTPATGGQKFRETVSFEEATKNAKVGTGWMAYNKFMQAFDIKVQQNGFDSYNSRGAGFLKEERNAWIEQQKLINPVWFNEYSDGFESGKYKSTLRAIDIVLKDKKFTESSWYKSDPTFKTLEEYMLFREEVVDYLKDMPSQNIDAQSNQFVKDEVDKKVRELKNTSPKFSLWYDRYLEQDKFEDINAK